MTRGNFLLITDTANWMSIQFNGDMYPSCNGKFVYHMLESVETYDDLAAAILKFDEERFGYADMQICMTQTWHRRAFQMILISAKIISQSITQIIFT